MILLALLGSTACSTPPPAPSKMLVEPPAEIELLLNAARDEPLALFHKDAEPALKVLASRLRSAVQEASSAYPEGASVALSPSARQEAETTAFLAGTIVGTLERAFMCAEEARMVREEADRTAAVLIETAQAYGLNEELPQGADALEWARKQNAVRRLALNLYDLSKTVPNDIHDELATGRSSASNRPCP